MPVALFARLSRIVPLLAVLVFIAAVVYIVMSFRYSSERAKATLIQVFTWLTGGLSVIFALVTIYALFEQNIPVIELFASFLGTTLVGLAITRICNAVPMSGFDSLPTSYQFVKTLINLDSEDEGQLFVGCAGGTDTVATFTYENEPLAKNYKPMLLKISGGVGGHSGDDINKERINAIQQLARFLFTQLQYDYQLLTFNGGNKANAICREAEAVIAVPDDEFQDMVADFRAFGEILKAEFRNTEPDLAFQAHSIRGVKVQPMAEEFTVRFISTLLACPHGVIAMSTDIPGLVETSTNLASVKMEEGNTIKVVTSQRSSVKSALHAAAEKVEAALLLGGADVEHGGELFGVDPEVKAIHAGLECGLFLEKFPDLDMISFGPTLRGVHAPGERLELASLDKFVDLLTDIVTNFA